MADLYVSTSGSDSGSGSRNSPFRTIRKASVEADSGSTVHVAPGRYEGGFKTTTDGVRYVSDQPHGAKIVGGGSSSDVAWDNRGDNVTISGFEVDGSNASWRIGLYSTGTNSVIEKNKVHDIAKSGQGSNGQGGAGIYADGFNGGEEITVRDNEVFEIGTPGANSHLVHGVYHTTSGSVTNNRIHENAGTGVHLWAGAHDLEITGNTVTDSYSGIWVGGDSAEDVTVTGNTVTDNRMYGIAEGGNTGDNSYSGNSVSGNTENWRLQTGERAGAAAAPTVHEDEERKLIEQQTPLFTI